VVRLLKIRNPWGERAPRTWMGAWGKDSDRWTPALQRELGVINSSGVPMDDPMSIFWMAFEDVKEYFSQVEVCRVHQGWHEVRQRAWLPSAAGPGQAFDLTVFRKTPVDLALWQEKHISREGALGARSTNVDIGLAVLRARDVDPEGCPRFELIEYVERACTDDVSSEMILEGGYVYRLVPLCFCQMLHPAPRRAALAVHSVHLVELKIVDSSWDEVACAAVEGAKRRGNRWADNSQPGVAYWLHHEAAGCSLAIENSSTTPAAVQVDSSDSIGCTSSRGELGSVMRLPPRTRTVALVLAMSPGAAYTRASILPQPVPLEFAGSDSAAAVGDHDLHTPRPLPPDSWRNAGPPPPNQEILRRRPQAAATPNSSSPQQLKPSTACSEGSAASASGGSRVQAPDEEDDDLDAAVRLSLTCGTAASVPASDTRPALTPVPTPSPAPRAPPRRRVAPPPGSAAAQERAKIQGRVKELFSEFRTQGMAPQEAASRAGEQARAELRKNGTGAS